MKGEKVMQRIKRKMPIIGAIILACAAVYFAQGCAGIGTRPSICDTLTEPSQLCWLSEKYNVRLEDIGNGLIVANAVAIVQGVYTKEDAIAVMRDIRAILDNPVSYAFFKTGVDARVAFYPGLLEIATVYFSELGGVTQIMYRTDRDILIGFLDKQIKMLGG